MIDFTLLCMGAVTALIWTLNPFAIPLVILPLYLIYTTLKVPALERKTEIDSKTGLYNAKFFSEELQKELDRANNFDRPLTVVLADLDLLRNINNTYGHLAGDEVLIGVANLLKNSLREYDIVARFGGEEFIILMPETTLEEAYQHIDELRESIETTEFSVPTSTTPIEVTVSFGIAGRMGYSETPNDIVHNADSALYHSKLNGRNRTCLFTEQGINDLFGTKIEQDPSQVVNSLEERVRVGRHEYHANPLRENSPQPIEKANESQSHSQPAEKQRPGWLINLFIGFLIIIAFPISIFVNRPVSGIDWFGLILFTLLVIVTEG
jgi:diguanylate cyclase (GGDEF)-like protein